MMRSLFATLFFTLSCSGSDNNLNPGNADSKNRIEFPNSQQVLQFFAERAIDDLLGEKALGSPPVRTITKRHSPDQTSVDLESPKFLRQLASFPSFQLTDDPETYLLALWLDKMDLPPGLESLISQLGLLRALETRRTNVKNVNLEPLALLGTAVIPFNLGLLGRRLEEAGPDDSAKGQGVFDSAGSDLSSLSKGFERLRRSLHSRQREKKDHVKPVEQSHTGDASTGLVGQSESGSSAVPVKEPATRAVAKPGEPSQTVVDPVNPAEGIFVGRPPAVSPVFGSNLADIEKLYSFSRVTGRSSDSLPWIPIDDVLAKYPVWLVNTLSGSNGNFLENLLEKFRQQSINFDKLSKGLLNKGPNGKWLQIGSSRDGDAQPGQEKQSDDVRLMSMKEGQSINEGPIYSINIDS